MKNAKLSCEIAGARNLRRELLEAIWLAAVFTLLVLVANGNFAQAQEAKSVVASSQATIVAQGKAKLVDSKKKAFALRMSMEAASSFHEANAYERKSETSLEIAPSFALTQKLSLSAVSVISREFDAAATTTLSNTKLTVAHAPLMISKMSGITPSISATLPTNKFAVDKDTYKGAAGVGFSMANDLQSLKLPLVVSVRTGYERSFHELTLNADSNANIRERIREGINVRWILGSKWSLSVDAMATQAWTYRGSVRNRFDLAQDLSFDVDSKLGLYIGHSNGGSAYKANGRDSNIALFDSSSSMLRAGASYVF